MTPENVTAVVTREGTNWLASVPAVPGVHTYAGNITALVANVQEAVALVLDLPEEAEPVSVKLEFADADSLMSEAVQIGEQREQVETVRRTLQSRAADAAERMAAAGYSMRDIAGVLRVTPGRVTQILGQHKRAG